MSERREFEGQPLTKREVLIASEAYTLGYHDARDGMRYRSRTFYPPPKVTRARVVTAAPGGREMVARQFRLVDGRLQIRAAGEGDMAWQSLEFGTVLRGEVSHGVAITPERVALWADLLANPTEEVEADE